MTREIKFRVWDTFTGSWRGQTNSEVKIAEDLVVKDGVFMLAYSFGRNSVIEQYTGLKDKDGKEIYEGDIVRARTEFEDEPYIGIIYWNHSYWAIGQYKLFVMNDASLKIAGNIHENYDMLVQN